MEMIPDQQGRIRVITPIDPAPGVELVINQDSRVRWLLKSLKYTLVTDGTVQNRIPNLIIMAGAYEAMRFQSRTFQLQNSTTTYQYMNVYSAAKQPTDPTQTEQWPSNILINDQAIILTAIVNLAAGDQIINVVLIVEEWIEPLV